jgi:tetrahydromethanopterin S-methyltransferase subunit G
MTSYNDKNKPLAQQIGSIIGKILGLLVGIFLFLAIAAILLGGIAFALKTIFWAWEWLTL